MLTREEAIRKVEVLLLNVLVNRLEKDAAAMIPGNVLNTIASILKDKDPGTVLFFLGEAGRWASPNLVGYTRRTFQQMDNEERHMAKVLEKDPSPLSRAILDDRKKGQGKKSLTRGRPRNWAEEITVLTIVTLYRDCFDLPRKSHEDPCLKILHLLLSHKEPPWHSFLKAIDDLS